MARRDKAKPERIYTKREREATSNRGSKKEPDRLVLPAISPRVASSWITLEVPFASQGKVSDSYPVGYKPPAPLYWNHNVYAYNKNTVPTLPATSATARRMIRLYYNMIPRDFQDVLGRQVC